ncbi:MAG: hypothetical protein NC041_04630 [Bacteroides sp.]|nr:hypothetical protein [Prevotella sp.]MCM1407245.1 hypothetical protein [Treponema brennaborense]MCM1469733.1 hypothetical protein [Bacteroides sp.]
MKICKYVFFPFIACTVLFFVSACKSTPEAEPPAAETVPSVLPPEAADVPVRENSDDQKAAAEAAREQCASAKKNAENVRADISAPEQFRSASVLMTEAENAAAAENWTECSELYAQAADAFDEAARLAADRRAEAERAIAAAKEQQKQSAEFAREADIAVPLPEEDSDFEPEL